MKILPISKKFISLASLLSLALVICIMFGAITISADAIWFNEIEFASEATVCAESSQLRRTPEDDAEVVCELVFDDYISAVYDIIGCDYVGVIFNGVKGFINRNDLSIIPNSGHDSAESLYDIDSDDYEYNYRYFMKGYDGYINGDFVYFRTEPNVYSDAICELMKYTPVVTMTDLDKSWIGVIVNETFGYVHSSYLGFVTPEEQESYEKGIEVALEAIKYEGLPYVSGCCDPTIGFDCATFVHYVYEQLGYKVSILAEWLCRDGEGVPTFDLHPGDIICFLCDEGEDEGLYAVSSGGDTTIDSSQDYLYCHHVGIYLGEGQFIRATKTGGTIDISTFAQFNELMGYEVPFKARRIVTVVEQIITEVPAETVEIAQEEVLA